MAAKQQLDPPPQSAAPPRPTITLPPRPSMDALFTGGFSPGPMTLLSSFFSSDSDQRSFSQLLAGAMASPVAATTTVGDGSGNRDERGERDTNEVGFKQNRPLSLMVGGRSLLFTVPPGLSPSRLLNSPGVFPPQSPFGMSHQQALAQVTAQAALANQSQMHMQAQHSQRSLALPMQLAHQSFSSFEPSQHQIPPSTSDPQSSALELSEISQTDMNYQPAPAVDKPNDDGYNWRKYGQKQIKGSEYPRSYYKCTHLNCPVKKKVERSGDGQVTEIIYKGQHNHEKPLTNKRARESSDLTGSINFQATPELGLQVNENAGSVSKYVGLLPSHHTRGSQPEFSQLDSTEPSSESEGGQGAAGDEDEDKDEPNPKRRHSDGASEVSLPHKTVSEPKIIVQTRSEVDLLDDGYRWRKYGQKVVKGNPHPRSYYRCTTPGCNVRKHVGRAAADPKAVITTYEGKHNHDIPASRNGTQNTANSHSQLSRPQPVVAKKHPLLKGTDFENNDQMPVLLRLKEEEIAAT